MARAAARRLLLLTGPALLLAALVAAASDRAGEYDVKAAFLYNFTKFVEWPEHAFASGSAPFVLAVLGDDPFDVALDQVLSGKAVGARDLLIRRHASLDELQPCQLLFVADDYEDRLADVLERLGPSPTLTVAEFDDAVTHGVVIGFRTSGRKVRFDINSIAAEARALKISSRLLSLAGTVVDGRQP